MYKNLKKPLAFLLSLVFTLSLLTIPTPATTAQAAATPPMQSLFYNSGSLNGRVNIRTERKFDVGGAVNNYQLNNASFGLPDFFQKLLGATVNDYVPVQTYNVPHNNDIDFVRATIPMVNKADEIVAYALLKDSGKMATMQSNLLTNGNAGWGTLRENDVYWGHSARWPGEARDLYSFNISGGPLGGLLMQAFPFKEDALSATLVSMSGVSTSFRDQNNKVVEEYTTAYGLVTLKNTAGYPIYAEIVSNFSENENSSFSYGGATTESLEGILEPSYVFLAPGQSATRVVSFSPRDKVEADVKYAYGHISVRNHTVPQAKTFTNHVSAPKPYEEVFIPLTFTLPAAAPNPVAEVAGYYPTEYNPATTKKIVTVYGSRFDLLCSSPGVVKAGTFKINGDPIPADRIKYINNTRIDLDLSGTMGDYYDSGVAYIHTITFTDPNYVQQNFKLNINTSARIESLQQHDSLMLQQNTDRTYKFVTSIPINKATYPMNSGDDLLTFAGRGIEKVDGANEYIIPPGTLINGVLTYMDTNSGAAKPTVKILDNGNAVFESKSATGYLQYVGTPSFTALSGPFATVLAKGTDYSTIPGKANIISFNANNAEIDAFVLTATASQLRLYQNAFSIGGFLRLGRSLPEFIRVNFGNPKLILDDLRFYAAGGAPSIKAHASIKASTESFMLLDFAGGDFEFSIDTTPEAKPQHFTIEGEMGVIDIITAQGLINLTSHDGVNWMLEDIFLGFEAGVGIPIVPPTVICQLTGVSGGIFNLNETLSYEGWTVLPPLRLELNCSIVDPTSKIIGASDAGVTFGIMSTEAHTGPVTLGGIIKLLDRAYIRYEMIDNGNLVGMKLNQGMVYIPDITYSMAGGGSVDLLNVVDGYLDIEYSMKLSKIIANNVELGLLLGDDLKKGSANMGSVAKQTIAGYVDGIDLSGSGKITGSIPEGVPIFGGSRFASASATFNKYRLYAAVQIALVEYDFTVDWDIPGNLKKIIGYSTDKAATIATLNAFNTDPGTVGYGITEDGIPYKITVGTNLTKLTGGSAGGGITHFSSRLPAGITPYDFSGLPEANKTFIVGSTADPVLVVVRSSTNTGTLSLSGPSGTIAIPDADYDGNGSTESWSTAAWSEVKDDNGISKGYYATFIAFQPTVIGEYTVTVDNSATIDIDAYSAAALPSITVTGASATSVSWTAANLKPGVDYRASVDLMRVNGANDEFVTNLVSANDEATAVNINTGSAAFTIPESIASGAYKIRVTLMEKADYTGTVINPDTAAGSADVYSPTRSDMFALAYTNSATPGVPQNFTAALVGNGQVQFTWDTVSGADGYILSTGDQVNSHTSGGTAGDTVEYDISDGTTTATVQIADLGVSHTASIRAYKDISGMDDAAIAAAKDAGLPAASYSTRLVGDAATKTYMVNTPTPPTISYTVTNAGNTVVPVTAIDGTTIGIYVNNEDGALTFTSSAGDTPVVVYTKDDAVIDPDTHAVTPATVVNFDNLVDGEAYNVTVTAQNATTKDFTTWTLPLYVDNTPPAISWNTQDVIDIATGEISLEGITEGALSSLKAGGSDIIGSFDNGRFVYSGAITGDKLTIEAVDMAGNKFTEELTFGTLTVSNPVGKITLDSPGSIGVGGTKTASLTVPGVTPGTVVWSCSPDSVATINSGSGVITGVAPGIAIVTATWDGTGIATQQITVKGPVTDLAVSHYDNTQTTLTWTAPEGATGVKLQESTDNSSWSDAATGISPTASSYTLTKDYAADTAEPVYYYRIVVTGGACAGVSNVTDRSAFIPLLMTTSDLSSNPLLVLTNDVYTVSFKSDGSDYTTKTVITPATTIDALPAAPTKAGSTFAGWNTAADGSGTAFDAGTAVTDDIAVYARWISSATARSISFYNEGIPYATLAVTDGATVGTLPTPPKKPGYSFEGWYTQPGGSGTPIDAYTTVTADLEAHAYWVYDADYHDYTVLFVVDGAPYETKSVVSPSTTVGTLPAAPTKTGYSFAGWFTRQDGSGTQLTASTPVTSDITVYAGWRSGSSGANPGSSGGGAATEPKVLVNGVKVPATLDKNGTLTLVYAAEEVERLADKTGTFDIDIAGYSKSVLNIDIPALGGDDVLIRTDFGAIRIPNKTLQQLRELYGDTLRLVITRGSFDVAFLDSEDNEVAYNDPNNPFTITLPYTLTETQDSNTIVAVKKDGRTKIIPFSVYRNGSVIITATATGTYDVLNNPKVFSDTDGHWAYANISFVAARELFSGVGDGLFSPEGSMTRAMFATVLSRLDGAELGANTYTRFSDVETEMWYTAAIEWAAEKGIVKGVGEGRFDPHAPIRREQMALMLANYAQYKGLALPETTEGAAFSDQSKISDWALAAVQAIQRAGIINGKQGNLFDPSGVATRAEVSAVFARFVTALTR